ncbi:cyclic nucleotide-gated ion channel 1-like [Pistacia vera]|uniref:cyclic nucleotide-gated ion channel 1-like n=1 Tax=Pistacia vera TaxID=55513 RepID=UPI001262F9C4|nr:cyclic nucleotide-gated ion channel 1-like [Pistacia vera]
MAITLKLTAIDAKLEQERKEKELMEDSDASGDDTSSPDSISHSSRSAPPDKPFQLEVIGSLWYFFAVRRLTECWKKTCIDHTGRGSFYCHDGFANHTFLNDFCPTKTLNTTIYDFGIFYDALQSGIVDVKFNNGQRKTYTFRWTLQNLSAFGQGLQTSVDISENVFVISITYFGVAFLVYFIGIFQISINYGSRGLFKMKLKNREINQWLSFRGISMNLQQRIEKHPPNSWEVIKGVNVKNLLNNLSKDLRSNIKRELGLDLLKKVRFLCLYIKNSAKTILSLLDIFSSLFFTACPAFHDERTHIVREGDPIDEMLFVLQGTTATTPRRTDHHSSEQDLLEECDFFGEELVAWARDDASPLNLPISTRTLQAVTNVDAFVLMAYDLRKILFIKHNQELVSDNLSLVSSDQHQGEPEITAEEQ